MSTAGSAAAAPLPPVPDHLAPIAITAVAGVPFTGAVATFNRPDSTGLASTINWGDGHNAVGIITSSGGQAYQILGTNTFAQPGSYGVVITIAVPLSYSISVQTTATVLASSINLGAAQAAIPSVGVDGFVGNAGFPEGLPRGGSATTPTVGNTPGTAQQNWPYLGPMTGPVRVTATDHVPWMSFREQGLDLPIAELAADRVPPDLGDLVAAGTANDQAQDVAARVPSQLTHFVMPNFASSAALALMTIFVSADTPFRMGVPVQAPAIARSSAPSVGDDISDPNQAAQGPGQDVYHLPFDRVAERGELGRFSGSPYLPSGALLTANASVLGVIPPNSIDAIEVEEGLPPAQASARQENKVGSVKRIFQVVTTWMVCQVLHSTFLQQVTRTSPSVKTSPGSPAEAL
jgi:hypothetical protein